MTGLTTTDLHRIGMDARNANAILGDADVPGKNVRGCCIDITHDVIETLTNTYEIPENDVHEYRSNIGEAMELHYAVLLESRHITDIETVDGLTIVDPAIDQFCTEQADRYQTDSPIAAYEDLPRVAILPPNDDRRKHWYHDPHGQYNTTTEFLPQSV